MLPWLAHGLAAGLHAHEPHGVYAFGAHFRWLKRGLGPETGSLGPSVWLHGRLGAGAREVLVAPTRGGSLAFVRVLARIEPGLHLGLALAPRSPGRAGPRLGVPALDDVLEGGAYDPARVAALLGGDPELLARLRSAAAWGVRIWDSAVEVPLEGAPAAATFGPALELAVDLAGRLAAARARLPATPGERAQIDAWHGAAAALGLALDAPGMVLRGTLRGTRVAVALETEAAVVHTAVEARFAAPLGVGLRVDRAGSPRAYLGRVVKTGDRAFDDLFRTTGWPPTQVYPVVGRADVRAALQMAATLGQDFQVHDRGLVVRVPGPLAHRHELERALALAVAVPTLVQGGGGIASEPAPYR